jgi:hypothetical protein
LIIEGIPEQVSKRDMDMVTHVTTYDQWKFQDQIGDMRRRQLILHPTANPLSLCTSFDYTKVPVAITVRPSDDFRPEDVRDQADYDVTVKQIIEGKGRFSLIHTRIPPSTVLWSAKPEESMIANRRSFDESDSDTFQEILGLTADEFARIQPRMLQYLDLLLRDRETGELTKM